MRDVLEKCGNAGNTSKCGISRTIAGWLTPMLCERSIGFPKFTSLFPTTILHNLHIRCSPSLIFADVVVDSYSTCVSIFSLMSRSNASTNVFVQITLISDV